MAKLIKRVWKSRGPTGHTVKKVAWGYTLQVDGQQERRWCGTWTKEEAQEKLSARILEREAPTPSSTPKTLGAVAGEYLDYKRGKGKRSIRRDEQILAHLKRHLGEGAPLH